MCIACSKRNPVSRILNVSRREKDAVSKFLKSPTLRCLGATPSFSMEKENSKSPLSGDEFCKAQVGLSSTLST